MKKPLRRLLAGLTLATAATLAGPDIVATPTSDTAWGAPDTTEDTAWGTPPTHNASDAGVLKTAEDIVNTVISPLDTAWG